MFDIDKMLFQDMEVMNINNLVNRNNVVLYRPKRLQNKFEDSLVVYKGDPETYSLKAFIKEN